MTSRISLCNLCVLCVSVVVFPKQSSTTEAQRTQRLHREEQVKEVLGTPNVTKRKGRRSRFQRPLESWLNRKLTLNSKTSFGSASIHLMGRIESEHPSFAPLLVVAELHNINTKTHDGLIRVYVVIFQDFFRQPPSLFCHD